MGKFSGIVDERVTTWLHLTIRYLGCEGFGG